MSKNQESNYQLLLEKIAALEKDNAELRQLKKSGRAIDEFALHQTELNLENNMTKLFSIYMMLSLYFKSDILQNQVDNYVNKIELNNKVPTLKTISSLIARVAKSLNLTKKQDEESTDILYKENPLIIKNNDDKPGF